MEIIADAPYWEIGDRYEGFERQIERKAREAWAEWLNLITDWKLFISITFSPKWLKRYIGFNNVGDKGCVSHWKDFRERYSISEPWFMVQEYQEYRKTPHIHAITNSSPFGNCYIKEAEWLRTGSCRIYSIDNGHSPAYYIAKYLVKENGNWLLDERTMSMLRWKNAVLERSRSIKV